MEQATLNDVNELIFKNQNKRTELKKEMYFYQNEKGLDEQIKDGRINLQETYIYLNDIEKQFTNDKSRSIAVKNKLIDDEIYNASLNRIKKSNDKLQEVDISLRENKIEYDFLIRRFNILMNQEGK